MKPPNLDLPKYIPDRKVGMHHHEKGLWILEGSFPGLQTKTHTIWIIMSLFWGPMLASQLRPHHQLEKFSPGPPEVLFYACAQFGPMFQRKRFHIETWIDCAGFGWLVQDLSNRNWFKVHALPVPCQFMAPTLFQDDISRDWLFWIGCWRTFTTTFGWSLQALQGLHRF